ncbi:MAG: response regulator [Ekhidna sp.]
MDFNLLIVEDDQTQRELITEALGSISDIDIEVMSAEDGSEAIKIARMVKFDAIITDFKMPKINGLEFIKWLKENYPHDNTPIIFVSGFMDQIKAARHANLFENVLFLEKPFEVKKICNYVFINLAANNEQSKM